MLRHTVHGRIGYSWLFFSVCSLARSYVNAHSFATWFYRNCSSKLFMLSQWLIDAQSLVLDNQLDVGSMLVCFTFSLLWGFNVENGWGCTVDSVQWSIWCELKTSFVTSAGEAPLIPARSWLCETNRSSIVRRHAQLDIDNRYWRLGLVAEKKLETIPLLISGRLNLTRVIRSR